MANVERDDPVIYIIPQNYTNSGRFCGLVEPRNAVEAIILVILVGYPELFIFNMPLSIRIIVMVTTLLPIAAVACFGIDGDSLFQFFGHVIMFGAKRRILHMRRVGYAYAPEQLKRKGKNKSRIGSASKGTKKERCLTLQTTLPKNVKSWISFRIFCPSRTSKTE